MAVLVVLEYEKGAFRPSSLAALTAALQFGEPVDGLLFGEEGADTAVFLPGLRTVFTAQSPAPLLAEPAALILEQLAASHSHIVAAGTSAMKDVLPRAAGKLDVQPLTEIVKIHDQNTFTRPIYAGAALETVRSKDPVKVILIRASSFERSPAKGEKKATLKAIAMPSWAQDARVLSISRGQSDRPLLENADIVISGGKGLKDAEHFAGLLNPLAKKMGAAIGASRAAVDAGFAPNEYQVGQTGQIIAPHLYLAFGLSGAAQHVAGMKESKKVFAVNIDPEAPIFKVADYGYVGDLFQVIPALTDRL